MKRALQTKITGKGQTAIPVAVQQSLGAKVGDSLSWELRENGDCVVRVVHRVVEDGAMSMLGFAKTFREARQTSAWVKELGGVL